MCGCFGAEVRRVRRKRSAADLAVNVLLALAFAAGVMVMSNLFLVAYLKQIDGAERQGRAWSAQGAVAWVDRE